ncbi:hypothetical protein SAY87_023026 [Trapa incisa]|uniref:Uncharacterized protein n=1 Tax=Trapa incisa TaxID=236973 RepID=A0AAN7KB59_9MYRT|nr:hypothetical protein SAY87_023026 [Trapa incisa]
MNKFSPVNDSPEGAVVQSKGHIKVTSLELSPKTMIYTVHSLNYLYFSITHKVFHKLPINFQVMCGSTQLQHVVVLTIFLQKLLIRHDPRVIRLIICILEQLRWILVIFILGNGFMTISFFFLSC